MPAPNRSRKPKKTSPAAILTYSAALIVAACVLYTTLFARAYSSSLQKPDTPDPAQTTSSADSSTSELFTRPATEPTYTTYPDTGETVATVLIDAGHGGVDSGKPNENGVLEKDLNLSIALKMGKYLSELNPQIEVKYIRTDDNVTWGSVESEDLDYRLAQQWEQNADYFISIHCNSFEEDPSVEGAVFFINPDDPVTADLTEKMRSNMSAINWAENYQTIDYDLLQLVTMSDIHSILIELGYMTNPVDIARLTDEEMQNLVAKALAAAVSDYIMENPDAPAYNNQKFHHGQRINTSSENSSDSAASSESSPADPASPAPASSEAAPAA